MAYIANDLDFFLILIFILQGGRDSMQPNVSVNIKWGHKYEYFIFSKYISHKKEIKVNNLTVDYGQNYLYSLIVLKFDPKMPIYCL